MISNLNEYISWTKENCNDYIVENKTEDPAIVSVAGETNDFNYTVTIDTLQSGAFKLPSDGVYKVSVFGKKPTTYRSLDESNQLSLRRTFSVFELGTGTAFDFTKIIFNDLVVYDSSVDGPADLNNLTNLTNALNTNLPFGVTWELVLPNITSTLDTSAFLGTSSSYRLVFRSVAGIATPPLEAQLVAITIPGGLVCYFDPLIYCQVEFTPTTGFRYITELFIDGINVLDEPVLPFQKRYDLDKSGELQLFYDHISQWLAERDNTVVESSEPLITYKRKSCLTECYNISSRKFENLEAIPGCEIEWHDYLYELCALHACVTKSVLNVFCQDEQLTAELEAGIVTDCAKTAKHSKQEMLMLSTLFFYGLIPLISKDRLEYFGDLVIDDRRIKNVTKIKDIYNKINDLANNCNACIEEHVKDCDCGC